jgi:hypothetical protein
MAPYGAKPVVADGGCPRYTARPEHTCVSPRQSPAEHQCDPDGPSLAADADDADAATGCSPRCSSSLAATVARAPALVGQAGRHRTRGSVPARGPPALAPGRALSEAGPLSGKPLCRPAGTVARPRLARRARVVQMPTLPGPPGPCALLLSADQGHGRIGCLGGGPAGRRPAWDCGSGSPVRCQCQLVCDCPQA